ncbi:hypothetical protein ACOMHN_022833 [Nucella lapillus]
MERLLRAVYRPHNLYCVHLDKTSPYSTWRALRGIVQCLLNVQIASEAISVQWGAFSVLQPELVCMRDLWANNTWKSEVAVPLGQDSPGSPRGLAHEGQRAHGGRLTLVDYVLHSAVSRDLLAWVNATLIPDETFFATLNHNQHLRVPGAYLDPRRKPYLSRYKNWGLGWVDSQDRRIFQLPCYGKHMRTICIFGVGDLPLLTSRWEMFANKFYREFQPLALDCLEEWFWNVTLQEYSGKVALDLSFYRNLDVARNHVDEHDITWRLLEKSETWQVS